MFYMMKNFLKQQRLQLVEDRVVAVLRRRDAAQHMGDVSDLTEAWSDASVTVKTEIIRPLVGLPSRSQNRCSQALEQLRDGLAAVSLAEDEQSRP